MLTAQQIQLFVSPRFVLIRLKQLVRYLEFLVPLLTIKLTLFDESRRNAHFSGKLVGICDMIIVINIDLALFLGGCIYQSQ